MNISFSVHTNTVICVFRWLKDALSTPKKAEFYELSTVQSAQERRIKVLEEEILGYKKILQEEQKTAIAEIEAENAKEVAQIEAEAAQEVEKAKKEALSVRNSAAVNTRWDRRESDEADFAAYCAEVQNLMTGEKPLKLLEALKVAGGKNPLFAAKFLQNPKRFIKLPF